MVNPNTLHAFTVADLCAAYAVLTDSVVGGVAAQEAVALRGAIQKELARRLEGGFVKTGPDSR